MKCEFSKIGRQTGKQIAAMTGGAALLLTLAGCHVDMWRQPKERPQSTSDFFADGLSNRLPVANTVVRGSDAIKQDEGYYTGYVGGVVNGKAIEFLPEKALAAFPAATDEGRKLAMLKRGQDRYNIFCTPCHGKIGDGNGMIAQRGFALRRPPGNYHTEALRKMPLGHFYDVIVNGYGSMYSYASRIQDVNDRWAIVAYIRALQLSQNSTMTNLTPTDNATMPGSSAIMPNNDAPASNPNAPMRQPNAVMPNASGATEGGK